MGDIIYKYLISTAGLLLVALGIALSIISNLGTSALSCPAYVLSLRWGLSVGVFTMIVNTSLIFIQLLVLRRRFKPKYLMQIPATLVFGYMIDFWLWALTALEPSTFAVRLALIIAGCAITAIGVSLEIAAQAWMLSAEMTVYAFTKVCTTPFGTLKIIMDCLFVIIAAGLSYILFSNPFGACGFTSLADVLLARNPNIVIGAGTVVCAILPGFLMKWTDPVVDRWMAGLTRRAEDRKWRDTSRRKR